MHRFNFYWQNCTSLKINSCTCAWHDPSRTGCTSSRAEYAGKCNMSGCTKVTKCHLPKATRCAPLQASSRQPMYVTTCFFSFYFCPSFSPLLSSARMRIWAYVFSYIPSETAPKPIFTCNFQPRWIQTRVALHVKSSDEQRVLKKQRKEGSRTFASRHFEPDLYADTGRIRGISSTCSKLYFQKNCSIPRK